MRRALLAILILSACNRVPKHRYGVNRLELEGVERFDEEAILACLATGDRDRVGLGLGRVVAAECGEPPFDLPRGGVELWAWPWTEWPLYDRVMLAQDRRRVERWYQARGYHAAEVTDVEVTPEQAERRDTIDPDAEEPGCDRIRRRQGCSVDVTMRVEEGEPTRIQEVALRGHEQLPRELRREVRAAITLRVGDPFDEAVYDASKRGIANAMATAGYARARVVGRARVDRPAREARVELVLEPGRLCSFGDVRVEGAEGLPEDTIIAAAKLDRGERFDLEELRDAQRAIYGLGAFSAVEVAPESQEGLSRDAECVVNVIARVTPARRHRFGLGGGVMAGQVDDELGTTSIPQWDLHVTARYENRNLFGGMQRLTLEGRPRMIFQRPFPQITEPRFGTQVKVELRQPGFLEPRTTLVLGSDYDFGPDPYDTFFRHRVDSRATAERNFWRHRIFASFGLRSSFYRVDEDARFQDGGTPADSDLIFLEGVVRLDLRDDPQRPHGGFYLQTVAHVAGFFLPSSWDYVRLTPDVRAYIPLPRRITIAARITVGAIFIRDASSSLDEDSEELGPRDYRLRGGGASDVRGYLPGRLGDGREGGTRRWSAQLELRVPLGEKLGVALFGDVGDVSRDTRMRFSAPQLSLGFGLRYYTIVPIRLDVGWAVPGAQFLGDEDPRLRSVSDDTRVRLSRRRSFPGAFHISIGETF